MERIDRIALLKEFLIKEPNDIFSNYALGIECFSEQKIEQAILQFEKVLSLNSNYSPAYYQLGKIFEAQLKNTEAIDYYKKGLLIAQTAKDNKSVNEFNEAIFLLED
jgi:tetratricopeptide (TPR) repeat protein